MKTELLTIRYYIIDGELRLEFDGIPPEALKEALKDDPSLLGAWRVQDRLMASVKAVMKDWDIINSV